MDKQPEKSTQERVEERILRLLNGFLTTLSLLVSDALDYCRDNKINPIIFYRLKALMILCYHPEPLDGLTYLGQYYLIESVITAAKSLKTFILPMVGNSEYFSLLFEKIEHDIEALKYRRQFILYLSNPEIYAKPDEADFPRDLSYKCSRFNWIYNLTIEEKREKLEHIEFYINEEYHDEPVKKPLLKKEKDDDDDDDEINLILPADLVEPPRTYTVTELLGMLDKKDVYEPEAPYENKEEEQEEEEEEIIPVYQRDKPVCLDEHDDDDGEKMEEEDEEKTLPLDRELLRRVDEQTHSIVLQPSGCDQVSVESATLTVKPKVVRIPIPGGGKRHKSKVVLFISTKQ